MGSLVTLAMTVLYMSVSPLNLRSLPPCPNPPVVMRVIAVDPKVTDAQLICAFVDVSCAWSFIRSAVSDQPGR